MLASAALTVRRGLRERLRERLLERLAAIPTSARCHLVMAHDLAAGALSLVLALWLRLGGLDLGAETAAALGLALPVFLVCLAFAGLHFRVHLGMWRYASLPDLVAIGKSATASIAALCLVLFLARRLEGIPRSVPLIQWFVLVSLLGGTRVLYRLLRGGEGGGDGRPGAAAALGAGGERLVPVLLVGTGAGTPSFIRALRNAPDQPFAVVGILCPVDGQRGRHILGVPVLGHLSRLRAVVEDLGARGRRPTRLVITGRLEAEQTERLVGEANALGIVLCRTPEPLAFKEASDAGRVELRPVALEDLLNRPQATLDERAIAGLIRGRRVLVTGAGGSIGGELVRQVAARGPAELALLDNSEFNLYRVDREIGESCPALARRVVLADVRQRERVHGVLEACRPDVVFHAAALKHVPMVELNPCEAILTNAIGTRNVADAVLACGAAAMVLISTDKAVNPTSIMGASKRLAEFYCQALDLGQGRGAGARTRTRFMTVRFGNVLGSSGSVVPLFQRQLARGGPLTVTHRAIERYFMTIPEAVALVLQASAHGVGRDDERGRIFVLDMGRPVRIVDVARRLIRLAGLEPDRDVKIEIVGLRPGEKLYEELFDDTEERLPPPVSGVLAAASRPMPPAELERAFETLGAIAARSDDAALWRTVREIIPGFAAAAAAAAGPPPGDRPTGRRRTDRSEGGRPG